MGSTADTSDTGSTIVVETDPLAPIVPNYGDFTTRRLPLVDPDAGYAYVLPDPPASVIGVVIVFHGTDGGVGSVRQEEWVATYNQYVPRGIGVVITQSADRESGRWSQEADLPLVRAILEDMDREGLAPDGVPLGVLAFSAGGQMAGVVASVFADEGWNLRAAAMHQSSIPITSVPTLYVAAENDDTGRTRESYQSSGIVRQCREAAGDCRLREGAEVALDPHRFHRVPDISLEASEGMFEELVGRSYVDAKGVRLLDVSDRTQNAVAIDAWANASAYPSASAVKSQLRVVWALHRFSSEFAAEEAAFFREHFLAE